MINSTTRVDAAELCEWLGDTSEADLRALIEADVIRPDSDGRFPLYTTVGAVIFHYRDEAFERLGEAGDG
jgi:hypothetical protein